MRIAYVLEQCWHRVPGGTATSAVSLADALQQLPDTEVIGVSARHRTEAPLLVGGSINRREMALPRHLLYAAWHRARRQSVQRATGVIDVIHATGFAVPPRSAPLVVTMHDLSFLHDRTGFTARGMDLLLRSVAISQAEACAVICPSEVVARDCAQAGFDEDLLRVVRHGVDVVDLDVAEIDETTTRLGLDRPFVLFVGTAEPRKGLDVLLAAMANVDPSVDLVLVGPAGWGVDLDALAAPLGDRVKRLGYVDERSRTALYAAASVFCYPSRREGFGLPVLEAMAQGTPVVTTEGTAMAEFARRGADLVPIGDVSALTDALSGLLLDPGRAAALGAGGRRTALALPWSRSAEATRAVYAEVSR